LAPTNQAIKNIVAVLKELEDTLVCPFKTEEEPEKDLSMLLPCGHFVTLRAWKTYQSSNHREIYHCVICQTRVESISKPYPVAAIGDIVRRIRQECQGLSDLLDWNQGISEICAVKEIMSTSEEVDHSSILHSLTPGAYSSDWNNHESRTKLNSAESPIIGPSPKGTPLDSASHRHQSSWVTDPIFGSVAVWEDEAKARDRRLSEVQSLTPAIQSPENLYRTNTTGGDSSYFSGTEVESLNDVDQLQKPPPKSPASYNTTSSRNGDYFEHTQANTPESIVGRPTQPKYVPTSPTPSSLPTNNTTDASSIHSDKGSPPVKGCRVKKVQVGLKKTYKATAISSTCETIALTTSSEFQIFSIPKPGSNGGISTKCCGFNDGRYGASLNNTQNVTNVRNVSPTYLQGAMSDLVLCIACAENCIDIHETSTGRRIETIEFPNRQCHTLTMSSNGERLAVGMETGDIFLYYWSEGNFLTKPTMIKISAGSKPVNCLAFSPDSIFMSYCSDNIIRTCALDIDVIREVSEYQRMLDMKACRKPYYGVTCLT
jgi:hypothetical protein